MKYLDCYEAREAVAYYNIHRDSMRLMSGEFTHDDVIDALEETGFTDLEARFILAAVVASGALIQAPEGYDD